MFFYKSHDNGSHFILMRTYNLIYFNEMLENKLSKIRLVMSEFRREHVEHCDKLLNAQKVIIEITG